MMNINGTMLAPVLESVEEQHADSSSLTVLQSNGGLRYNNTEGQQTTGAGKQQQQQQQQQQQTTGYNITTPPQQQQQQQQQQQTTGYNITANTTQQQQQQQQQQKRSYDLVGGNHVSSAASAYGGAHPYYLRKPPNTPNTPNTPPPHDNISSHEWQPPYDNPGSSLHENQGSAFHENHRSSTYTNPGSSPQEDTLRENSSHEMKPSSHENKQSAIHETWQSPYENPPVPSPYENTESSPYENSSESTPHASQHYSPENNPQSSSSSSAQYVSWQPPDPDTLIRSRYPGGSGVSAANNNPYDLPADYDPYQTDESMLVDYQDNIKFIDCNYFLRKKLRLSFLFRDPTLWQRLWLVKDCAGIAGTLFTWFLIVFGEIVFILVVLIPFHDPVWSTINGVFSCVCSFLGFVAHVRCVFMDPGAVPRGNATKENIQKLGLKDGQIVFKCPKCVSIKPERAHHCSVCRRCIKKMDHHCPWVNNCIGENNQKFFVLFTMYICLISVHALYMAIHHFIVCIREDWKECTVFSPAATTIFMIFLLFEALLFGIFTAIMCGTQMSAICTDETAIEQLKNEENPNWEKKSMWLSIKAVFGHPFSYKWFSPFHSTATGKDKLYLYNV